MTLTHLGWQVYSADVTASGRDINAAKVGGSFDRRDTAVEVCQSRGQDQKTARKSEKRIPIDDKSLLHVSLHVLNSIQQLTVIIS